jgi:hypothetical protein
VCADTGLGGLRTALLTPSYPVVCWLAAHTVSATTLSPEATLSAHKHLDAFRVCGTCDGRGTQLLFINRHTTTSRTCLDCQGDGVVPTRGAPPEVPIDGGAPVSLPCEDGGPPPLEDA